MAANGSNQGRTLRSFTNAVVYVSASLTLHDHLPSWLMDKELTKMEQDLALLLPEIPGTRAPVMKVRHGFRKATLH